MYEVTVIIVVAGAAWVTREVKVMRPIEDPELALAIITEVKVLVEETTIEVGVTTIVGVVLEVDDELDEELVDTLIDEVVEGDVVDE